MQVFYCTYPSDDIRAAIARPCLMMWERICGDGEGQLIIIIPTPGMSGREFQSWRRAEAERLAIAAHAYSYIIADDDCMPLGSQFIERCQDLIARYTDFAILGTEDYCAPYGEDEIYETSTAGGINVIRRGVLQFPPYTGQTWDGCAQGEQVRAKGFRVGRMRDVRRNHFGDGLSTVWPDNYASGRTQVAYLGKGGVLV